MDRLMESNFMKALQRGGEKLASNKGISALMTSMMGMMAVLLVGATCQILAALPTLFGWTTTQSAYYQAMMVPYNMTVGLLSIPLSFSLGYNFARNLGLKPLVNGISSVMLFLIVAAPLKTVTLASGGTFTGLDSANLGSNGIFTAILVSFLSVGVVYFFDRKRIVIKMPDAVPEGLGNSLNALLPFLANVAIWYGISIVVSTQAGTTLPLLITRVLSKPIAYLNSVPGMLVCLFIATTLWFFGIHGGIVVRAVLMPITLQCIVANGDAVAAGQAPVFYPVFLFEALGMGGGGGNTLSLILMSLRSKSEQLRAVAKAALVPGLCRINEPATFGFPIMYNPLLGIPYILNPMLTAIVLWIGYSVGFFKPPYIVMTTGLVPIGVQEFMQTLAWQNLLMPVVAIVISGLCYYPFFKAYEKQLVEKEAAAKAAAAN